MRRSGIRHFLLVLLAVLATVSCGGGGSGTTEPAPVSVAVPSALSYTSPQTYTVGAAIQPLSPTVTGAVTSYSVSPSLPPGLGIAPASGQISGTPTAATVGAAYTITAQNSAGTTAFNLSITVIAPASLSLEPATATTIGIGQAISVFAAFNTSSAAPYPAYVDPAQVTWTSSDPGFAAIDRNGVVTGLSEGSTSISAQYQAYSSQLTVQVSGTLSRRNVSVPGQGVRQYSIYVPPLGNDIDPHPLLLSLHGGGGSAMIQASTSQLNRFAQQQKIYVAYLEGTGAIPTFNAGSCCGAAQTQNVDDVLYVRTVLDDIQAIYNPAKVFATGFSNGAMMTHRLGCALADRIDAIAAVSGGAAQFDKDLNQFYTCNPTRPIPVLHVHATNDRNYPFAGGVGEGLSATNFYSIDATIADWGARNNVTSQPSLESVTATTTCYRYSVVANSSIASAPVVLCKVDPVDNYDSVNEIVFGGGHSWPGGVRSPAANSDVPVTDFNANAYMWNFLVNSSR